MAGATTTIMSSQVMRTLSNRTNLSQFLVTPSTGQRTIRSSTVLVRCMSEGGQMENKTPLDSVAPPSKPKMSTRFSDILAFSGPAPERINGRLAMIGIVAAVAVELSSGHDLFSQVSDGGITWFVGSSVLLSLASLIPLLKGVSVESKSDGFMTSDAELWNGRFAMLGLVSLAITELVKGGAFI
ncbi:Early light-induced protein chloroplastic [Euphorbia peplus]|nr:Early light-induced protein chloroplastic [Euphorbia peplus]